jgi:hypothetical protein
VEVDGQGNVDAQQVIWREEVKESVRVVEKLLKGEM